MGDDTKKVQTSDDGLEVVPVPKVQFEFGDARFRVLYGPANATGGRKVVGLISEDAVEALEKVLEQAE